jgi:hypothetical protein
MLLTGTVNRRRQARHSGAIGVYCAVRGVFAGRVAGATLNEAVQACSVKKLRARAPRPWTSCAGFITLRDPGRPQGVATDDEHR